MKIAILGGGVAGVSSAIALSLKGFDVSLYERHEQASDIGAGIVIWPNAAFVLDQLGVLNAIDAKSGRPTKMQRRSSTNDNLGAIDIEEINRLMGYASRSILRSDFQHILLTRLASLGVRVHYGHAVNSIVSKSTGQAEVHFQNGTQLTADVLIGADGRMASYARRYVHGDNAPVYQGFINWVGVYEADEDFFQEIEVSDYWGIGERFGIVPITKRKAYWAGAIASADIGLKNPDNYQAELASVFAHWPTAVQMMIQHTPAERINKIYVHDHDPIQTWHKDNLIVIGDAAHAPLPTSGQGACQALEDAWHLANVLQESPHDIQYAFAEFTKLRAGKTAGITMAGRGFAASLFNR
ncbi:MAG: FAD-dependent monooxygenase, partial [Burkholderiales bacterium]|nr:FAD-dependent monooxygenase [Burkholderiales bacterium]